MSDRRTTLRRSFLVTILGLVITGCGGGQATPTPTVVPPTLAPLPTATAGALVPGASSGVLIPMVTPTTVGIPASQRVVVINTEGDGANLRAQPARTGQSLAVIPEGDELDVVGADQSADGITWRNVRDRSGNTGWISAGFLGPPGSQSTIPTRAPATRAPAVTATRTGGTATATRGTATATRGATTEATSVPATVPAKIPPPTAGLAVQASVSRPVISSGSQGLHVRITNGGQPVAGARVVAVVQDKAGAKTLDLGATDSSGVATRSFDVGSPSGTVTIAITVTTPDGRSTNATTSYSAP